MRTPLLIRTPDLKSHGYLEQRGFTDCIAPLQYNTILEQQFNMCPLKQGNIFALAAGYWSLSLFLKHLLHLWPRPILKQWSQHAQSQEVKLTILFRTQPHFFKDWFRCVDYSNMVDKAGLWLVYFTTMRTCDRKWLFTLQCSCIVKHSQCKIKETYWSEIFTI